jgi:uncharacterized protein YjbI with pentapeptide repeats
MADSRLPAPTGEQLGWLSVDPPSDEHGDPIRWTLGDCRIDETKWQQPIVHNLLTLERAQLVAVQWSGPVFRNCLIRDVSFERCNFAHARFENVSFERCSFTRCAFENSAFDHCRFRDCTVRFHTAIRTALRFCEVAGLALDVIDMRECELSGTTFEDSRLHGPRLAKTRADSLELDGGELRGGDLTACELARLELDDVSIAGVRVIDSELGRVSVRGGPVEGLAISGTSVTRLVLARCPELPGARIIDSKLAELQLDGCPAVASLLIADSTITTLTIRSSTLYDAAFERVVVGHGRIEAGELTGALFDAGEWQLETIGVALNDYVAVKHTRFNPLHFDRPSVDPKLDLRLDGDSYASGSMTWSSLAGGVRGP